MINETINDLIKDLNDIEYNVKNNISKINIIIIKINNNEIENIIKKNQRINNNIINKELINKIIKKVEYLYCENEYKIKYLLNFEINKNIHELENIKNIKINENYKLNILKQIENIKYDNSTFTNINSLIIILNKLEKVHYIKRKEKKHNSTKKNK
tara:strand:- start:156 stop:623 length:468 start_codon:yes stop_codon:yes gene_type:complete